MEEKAFHDNISPNPSQRQFASRRNKKNLASHPSFQDASFSLIKLFYYSNQGTEGEQKYVTHPMNYGKIYYRFY